MDIGMLWYDDDKKAKLDEKVARAVEYYRTKYGVQPTECYVHPGMLGDGQPSIAAGVRLRGSGTVIKNHFWLGVGDQAAGGAAPRPVNKRARR
jgi:hypothetical protein